ncbi:MAG: MgtC/SapB family protein [bacterium]|nr:MgtC/SapB family protein [bacterium]
MDVLENVLDPRFFELLFRLLVAVVCGILVGLEREYRNKPAGVRTHMLISLGAALFMIISIEVAIAARAQGYANADPGRIAAQVVSGVGFLGAGAILRTRGLVLGLTSAATIWCMAAIGLAAGSGMLWTAVFAALGILLILQFFTAIENLFRIRRFRYMRLEVILKKETKVFQVRKILREMGMVITEESLEMVFGENHYQSVLYFRGDIENSITDRLMALKGVTDVMLFNHMQNTE